MSTVIRRPLSIRQVRLGRYAFPFDGLTVDQLETLEVATPPELVAALLTNAGIDPYTVRWADITIDIVDDDLPDIYEDGRPVSGGRAMDGFITLFARPPWCWPPDVTRRQTIRDLRLILASLEGTS